MKKGFFVLLICTVFLLVGCGSKSEELKCSMSNDFGTYKVEAEYTIYYSGEYVNSVESIETVTSNSNSILEYMESTLKNISSTMEKYGGYTSKVEKSEGKIISKTTTDYKKMDLKQVKADDSTATYIKDDKVSLSGLKEMYSSMGIKCD